MEVSLDSGVHMMSSKVCFFPPSPNCDSSVMASSRDWLQTCERPCRKLPWPGGHFFFSMLHQGLNSFKVLTFVLYWSALEAQSALLDLIPCVYSFPTQHTYSQLFSLSWVHSRASVISQGKVSIYLSCSVLVSHFCSSLSTSLPIHIRILKQDTNWSC